MDVQTGDVVKMQDLPMEEPEQEQVPEFIADQASIGDVLQQGVTQPIPEGWHECDGSTQPSYRWPEFVGELRITEATFVLPKPERTAPGHRFIIKLGRRFRPTAPSRKLMLQHLEKARPDPLVLGLDDDQIAEVD